MQVGLRFVMAAPIVVVLFGCQNEHALPIDTSTGPLQSCAKRALYSVVSTKLARIELVGTVTHIHDFQYDVGDSGKVYWNWHSRGERLALAVRSKTDSSKTLVGIFAGDERIALVENAGRVFVGATGEVVFDNLATPRGADILDAAGVITRVSTGSPVAPPIDDGLVPVSVYGLEGSRFVLARRSATGSWADEEISDDETNVATPAVTIGSRFVTVSYPDAQLHVASRTSVTHHPLPSIDTPYDSYEVVSYAEDRYVLLSSKGRFVWADLETLALVTIERPTPFREFRSSAAIDEAGAIYLTEDRGENFQIVRSEDRGATFVDLGAPIAKGSGFSGQWLALFAHRGAVLALQLGYENQGDRIQMLRAQYTRGDSSAVMAGGYVATWLGPMVAGEAPQLPSLLLSGDGMCVAGWLPRPGSDQYDVVALDENGVHRVASGSDYGPLRFIE